MLIQLRTEIAEELDQALGRLSATTKVAKRSHVEAALARYLVEAGEIPEALAATITPSRTRGRLRSELENR